MAGNRLDALVAEHIFGEAEPTVVPITKNRCKIRGPIWWWTNRSDGTWGWATQKYYSSEASASESLLEKMRELGWMWLAVAYSESEREKGGIYYWQFYQSCSADAPHPSARSNSRLECIVLAALRAVGVPESEIQEAMCG